MTESPAAAAARGVPGTVSRGKSRPGRPEGSGPDPGTGLSVIGGGAVVWGGLVAAVTGPLELDHGSWMAAYLVLVGGVAQYAMGRARSWRQDGLRRWGWAQVGCWNLGSALVIAGTLAGEPPLVDLGSTLLVVALVIALRAASLGARTSAARVPWLLELVYRVLLLVLAVSIPVGIVLSYLRHA